METLKAVKTDYYKKLRERAERTFFGRCKRKCCKSKDLNESGDHSLFSQDTDEIIMDDYQSGDDNPFGDDDAGKSIKESRGKTKMHRDFRLTQPWQLRP